MPGLGWPFRDLGKNSPTSAAQEDRVTVEIESGNDVSRETAVDTELTEGSGSVAPPETAESFQTAGPSDTAWPPEGVEIAELLGWPAPASVTRATTVTSPDAGVQAAVVDNGEPVAPGEAANSETDIDSVDAVPVDADSVGADSVTQPETRQLEGDAAAVPINEPERPAAFHSDSVLSDTVLSGDAEHDEDVDLEAEADVSRETAVPAADVPSATEVRWPRPTRRRVMTIANQKGGVGKTTSTVNLAVALAMHGVRVLVVDLDPQGNASTAFNVPHQSGTPSVYDVLIGDKPLADVCVAVPDVPNLWCAPATIDLAGAEIELVSVVARESRLRRALDTISDLDYVLIDCPPSLGLLTINAMVAASEVLIPIQCEFYALEGLSQLLNNVELVRTHLNAELRVSTILLTMYDARTRLADQVAAEVRSHFADLVLDAVIPRSVRISEAPGFGQTVVTFDPSSRGALAYVAAAYDLAQRGSELDQ